jgi:hypothetical protein
VGAHPAADAGGALHVLVGHGVGADVDAHFAVGRAVPSQDAHVPHGRRLLARPRPLGARFSQPFSVTATVSSCLIPGSPGT